MMAILRFITNSRFSYFDAFCLVAVAEILPPDRHLEALCLLASVALVSVVLRRIAGVGLKG